MPNWCEGTLKIRGNIENVERWCKENINIYKWLVKKDGTYVSQLDVDNPIKINIDEEEINITVPDEAYIEGTKRNFVEPDSYYNSVYDDTTVLVLNVRAAWFFESEPYITMSRDYGVDFRFYGFECGMEFNQEIIIENGELVADNEITYDDYFWECPFPLMGG